ncbi:hypothetical protein SNE40_007557 [Patella caerulea]|uniref:Uncharacterized protein n=1 Tax=Patella caerulea TaxID=87958 RepID=A0AAN8Q2H6_PATCE
MTTKETQESHINVLSANDLGKDLNNGHDNPGFEKDNFSNRTDAFNQNFRRNSVKQEDKSQQINTLYGGALIINAIIGPGIFTSPKGVVKGAGSVGLTLIIWGSFGVFSAFAALCFTELRESVSREGVEYAYITEAFGPLASFVYCWMRIAAAEPVATAIFCMGFADYTLDAYYDDCGPSQLHRKVLGILAVVTLAYLNVFSAKLSEKVQVLGTIGKTVALAVIIICGIIRLANGHVTELKTGFDNTETNPTAITSAIYNCLWAYGGWASVNNVTKGVRKPPRNLPRLIKVAIPTVGVIFMAVVTSYFTVMTKDELVGSEAIGVTWSDRVLGAYSPVIPIGVGFLALRSANATFLDAGKLSGVAVKDNKMPEVTAFVHVRSKTPILTVITRAIIAIIMIILGTLSSLLNFFIFIVWAFHGLSVLALIVLRFKNKKKKRPYKVYLFMPVIVVLGITILLITPFLERPKDEFIIAISLFILSFIAYLPVTYLKSYNPLLFDKVTVWLQLFLRIVPRRALRRKASIMKDRMYSRRMSTPETRGYLRYNSTDKSGGIDNNNDSLRLRKPVEMSKGVLTDKPIVSILKRSNENESDIYTEVDIDQGLSMSVEQQSVDGSIDDDYATDDDLGSTDDDLGSTDDALSSSSSTSSDDNNDGHGDELVDKKSDAKTAKKVQKL